MNKEKRKVYNKAYRQKNKDILRAYDRTGKRKSDKRAYYQKNESYWVAYRKTDKSKAYTKMYHKTDKWKTYQKGYNQRPKVKEMYRRVQKEYVLNNPEKIKAHRIANNRKLRGTECNVCNSTETLHGHHPDYSQPEVIVTLCREHHEEVHTN